ncbi:TetR/AcrR family transcriptional regulator [Curtobacterium flaccumfaciens]|uniref:TetR/AcrR family transcriptional regulator n=1 Tax=Curtobacterium flaccumfaciens TaxID=2035 RepID=UPI001E31BF57|nr:TetR/AcrR family transcriptional regulator [Curtobacterium allii]MCE0459467.1 TetR/AcrR family transcriptional regulator [Curtobacterium allii]
MAMVQQHRSVEERRDQLVDAALSVLRTQGLRAVTTRAVTEAAGLPHGAFHYCFATKTELFRAVLDRQVRATTAAAFAPSSSELGPVQRIAAGLRAHLDRIQADPDTALSLLELQAHSRREADLRELTEWDQREYFLAVTTHVTRWATGEGFRWVTSPEHVARLLVAAADGIATAWLNDRDDGGAEATVLLAATTIATLSERSAP